MASKLIFFAYRILGALCFPILLFYFLIRVFRNRAYWATLRQRLGFLPREYQQTTGGAIWFHAVSLGEVLAIEPLLAEVRLRFPATPLFVSSATLAGHASARAKFGAEAAGVFYAPVDYASVIRRVLARIRPSVVVVAETEIWPNLFRESRKTGAGLLVVNGRISDGAAPRYRLLRRFFAVVLCEPSVILAQSEAMRKRFVQVGAQPSSVRVGGNLKYDSHPQPADRNSIVARYLAGAQLWVAASTSEDENLAEEDAVIAAFQNLRGWKLLLAPRRPERFDAVAGKLARAGLRFTRRSVLQEDSIGNVLLLDTVGELASLFSLADSVFVGGTLASHGGHNILEPAWFGKTITVGPHLENFAEIAAPFRAAHALVEIQTPAELQPFIDPAVADRARACAREHGGAAVLAADCVAELHGIALPRSPRSVVAKVALSPLARIWRLAGAWRRAASVRNQERLRLPVISVGNITVGGTGKTPAVLHLARLLAERGRHPGVLTRGYGRASPHGVLAVARGAQAARSHTGDEAQILLRSGLLSLGVSASRAAAGRELDARGWADVLILDDGFQHLRLARNFDLVLIDSLEPFGACELVPLGRLREPLDELRRASAFLITRVTAATPVQAITTRLHQLHPCAPVFLCSIVAGEWVELEGGSHFSSHALPFRQVLAFCGLGNPQSFWQTLAELKIRPLDCLEFGDHHVYTPREVRRLGQLGRALGAEVLLTTEKDAMNLCEYAAETIRPLRIFALRIGIAIEREAELLDLIATAIE